MEKYDKQKVKIMLAAEDRQNKERQILSKESKKKAKLKLGWPLRIFVLTLSMSLLFGVLSEFVLSKSGLIIATVVIIILLIIAVVFDGIGVAVTACDGEVFKTMAEKNVRGAREALLMVKHCEKVASFSCDIVGDICSILSGSAGAAIVSKINLPSNLSAAVLIATLVSSFIASLTVFGKALGKTFAINSSASFVFKFARFISLFTSRKKRNRNDKKQKSKYRIQCK